MRPPSTYHWYDYDPAGRLVKVFVSTTNTKPASPELTLTYWPAGEVKAEQFRGNAATPLWYTIRGWVEHIGDIDAPLGFAARYSYFDNGIVDGCAPPTGPPYK